MQKLLVLLTLLVLTAPVFAKEYKIEIATPADEGWWGGLCVDGSEMPFSGAKKFSRNLFGDNAGNQATPLLVSNKGRYVWSEQPIAYTFGDGKLVVTSQHGEIKTGKAGETLRTAFLHCSKNFFPANGKMPDPLLFTHPQYNTWIELMYEQNEKDIRKYSQAIVDNGYPTGVLMIDDNWQSNYGDWTFSKKRFDDPKAMMKKLHSQGFKLMLWVCPFVMENAKSYPELASQGLLLLNKEKKPAMIKWWNGKSALLDLSNPKARDWFNAELDKLVKDYDADGFKLDAGDTKFYRGELVSFKPTLPNEHTMHFARIGLKYPLNEYRASWKMAGLPLAQRLRDKGHRWGDLEKLIPDAIAQGLMGYAFTCPDMIGGGEYRSFLNAKSIDQELIVRSAQCSALMAMMQFSVAPWRILNDENQKICLAMAKLHTKMGPKILELAKEAAKTGEPIVRSLEYQFPGKGYASIKDQFLLGENILVAPVTKKGARSRKVVLPDGTWKGDDGSVVVGPKTIEIEVPLTRLPYYERGE